MEQKQDYKEKYEKGKLHTRYLLIIAGILAIIGISIAIGGNGEALGQISMASTVSSIILSSIAIFMSISGENKLNYTHDKLVETSDRMSDITDHIEKANNILDSTINQKLIKIDAIFDTLEHIGRTVDNVEKEVLNRAIDIEKESIVSISNDVLWEVYNGMVDGRDSLPEKAARSLVEYIVVSYYEGSKLNFDNMRKYVIFKLGSNDENLFAVGLAWGILGVFIKIGITLPETAKYFAEKMDISEEKRNEIKSFL